MDIPKVNIKDSSSQQGAVQTLKRGGILIFPTETVYGIGCLLFDSSIKKLYQIKQRPLTQATSVLMTYHLYNFYRSSDKSTIKIPTKIRKDFLLGKVTIIFPAKIFKIDFPKIITKDNTIGVRLPQFKWLEKIINLTGPIVASSANIKDKLAPATFFEIDKNLFSKADLVIETTIPLKGTASKVFDLDQQRYLRD